MTVRIFATTILVFFCTAAMAYEESSYRTVFRTEVVEVRHYPERVVAEVAYSGENSGFRILFGYISGNNKTAQTVEMKTPVTRSTKIDMTTPVTQTKSDDRMVMRFFLPASFTLETAPEPTDPAVTIRTVASGHFAAIRYSGRANDRNFAKHRIILLDELRASGLTPLGPAIRATYNGPFTPPFLRRNEAMYRIEWQ